MTHVLVIGYDPLVRRMFEQQGFKVTESGNDSPSFDIHPDLLCFTGGEDVSPTLYKQLPLKTTNSNPIRDEYEIQFYSSFPYIPKVGICRGGQFLAVMNGDTLLQHIDGHTNTEHNVKGDCCLHRVNSDHHQAILFSSHYSTPILSTHGIVEACFYSHSESLCFQPHPEWNHKETHDVFFTLISQYLHV